MVYARYELIIYDVFIHESIYQNELLRERLFQHQDFSLFSFLVICPCT